MLLCYLREELTSTDYDREEFEKRTGGCLYREKADRQENLGLKGIVRSYPV